MAQPEPTGYTLHFRTGNGAEFTHEVPIEPWSHEDDTWLARGRACSSVVNFLIGALEAGSVCTSITENVAPAPEAVA